MITHSRMSQETFLEIKNMQWDGKTSLEVSRETGIELSEVNRAYCSAGYETYAHYRHRNQA